MTIGRDPVTGKLKRVCIYGKTRQEVAHQLAQDLSDMHRGSFVAPHKRTLGEWLDAWLRDYKKPGVGPVTYDSYEIIVRHHLKPALRHIPLKDLRPD